MAGEAGLADLACAAGTAYSVTFAGLDPGEHRLDLDRACGVAFESVPPVRLFARYHGQRSNTGLWGSATTGRHVGFESWLERDHLMLLDFDPTVAGIASQPLRLHWDDGQRVRRHVPDFFVRQADGTGVLVDVRPAGRIRAADVAAFAATAAACRQVGWQYRLVHEPDPVITANVRWLAGYRHPRCRRPALAVAAETVFATTQPLMRGAALLDDLLVSLPVVFHLLWHGRLRTDLSVVLSHASLVTTVDR